MKRFYLRFFLFCGSGLLAVSSAFAGPPIVADGGTVGRTQEEHFADEINVRDFGARGDVSQVVVASTVGAGATQVSVSDIGDATVGSAVGALALPRGTTITHISGTVLTLSSPFAHDVPAGLRLDIGGTDDASAVQAAVNHACESHGRLLFRNGRFYFSSLSLPCTDIAVQLDRASIAWQSAGLPGIADQSQAMTRSAQIVGGQQSDGQTENVQYLSAIFSESGKKNSYQHNIQSVVGWNNDPYLTYTRPDGSLGYYTHDAVGQYLAMSQAPTNTNGNSWVWNHVLNLKEGSNGSSVIGEAQIVNDRTTGGGDFDGINTIGGYDEIYDCKSECLYAHFFQGRTPGGRPGLTNGFVFRHGLVSNMVLGQLTPAIPGKDGLSLAAQHQTDWAIYSSGLGFFDTLHVGGGKAIGDAIPSEGLNVDEKGSLTSPSILTSFLNATLAINIGSGVSSASPFVQFAMQKAGGASSARLEMSKPGVLTATVEGAPVIGLHADGIFAHVDYRSDGKHGVYGIKSAQLAPVVFAHLDADHGAGTIAYCSDCYSTLAGSSDRGMLVTWNGRKWVDGVGKAVGH
ncbi:hypothetical protein [Acetobacter conturbans]|uniref:Pectate lyase superfamily protein domain-containing protein n=1 Tax=Acetobacter conturbans TaxID=1737472 RepID=A0ABX0K3I3_9PROT|nr:hypothetical protein [Acetobacter conturbans]NHN89361.1 hypothetical protein [Acetobacter conturbans]